MKKITLALIMLFSFAFSNYAQTTKTEVKKTRVTKEGKPDMRMKENKQAKTVTEVQKTAKTTMVTKSTGTNKDGSPDKRMKMNKTASVQQAPASTSTVAVPVTKTTTTTAKSSQTTTSSSDKVIGPDSKGRTIYEGPRGGRYYINKNGHKEYIKH